MTSFVIKYDFPGYLRVGVDISVIKDSTMSFDLDAKFSVMPGILEVKINPLCNSILLRYDTDSINKAYLIDMLKTFLADKVTTSCALTSCDSKVKGCSPVKKELKLFTGITVLTLGAFIRNSLGLAVSQSFFSPLGLLTLGFSLPIIKRGVKSIKQKRPNMDGFLAGGILASLIGGEALTALEILWINSGADTLSAWIKDRSRKHISDILEITSHNAFVVKNGIEIECKVSELRVGDIVAMHTGEKISVDGTIVFGKCALNEAPINGHQELKYKEEGDEVFAGTFVQEGVIHVLVEGVGDNTYLARIMTKVEHTLENRAPIEGVADKLAERVLKLGVSSTIVTYLMTGSAMRAYTVLLVMACPCATVLAATTAISAAMNAAARNKILIKGGRYLEEIGKCKTVFFDKTGTLTTSTPNLSHVALVDGVTKNQLLQLAVSVEMHNQHPLAQAVIEEAREHDVLPIPCEESDYHLGMGMKAIIENDEILIGNKKLLNHYGVALKDNFELESQLKDFESKGVTVVYVFKNSKLQGILGFEATERPETKATLQLLRSAGVERIVLITGDEDATAKSMAQRLGMDDYYASLMPEDKGAIINAEMQKNGPVIMIGDGINDALALTQADVGIAFGTAGSEVAIEAADIALVKEDLTGLVQVYILSQKTLKVVNENFWIATGSNAIGVVLGALGILTPVTAGLVHVGHSLGVLANSSRLLALPDAKVINEDNSAPKKSEEQEISYNE